MRPTDAGVQPPVCRAGTTVLVADDDQRARWRTAAALRLGGYTVESARTTNEAGALLRRLRLAALVVDPATDQPHEIIAEIRARTDAPIIVVSARHEEREKVAALGAGADDYLVKPFGSVRPISASTWQTGGSCSSTERTSD